MITPTELRIRYREFSDEEQYTDARIQLFINDAVLIMADEDRWLDWYSIAQAALVGHLLVINENSESGDTSLQLPVSNQTVDDVSVGFAVKPVDVSTLDYLSTIYGQTYYRYVRMTFIGIIGV